AGFQQLDAELCQRLHVALPTLPPIPQGVGRGENDPTTLDEQPFLPDVAMGESEGVPVFQCARGFRSDLERLGKPDRLRLREVRTEWLRWRVGADIAQSTSHTGAWRKYVRVGELLSTADPAHELRGADVVCQVGVDELDHDRPTFARVVPHEEASDGGLA